MHKRLLCVFIMVAIVCGTISITSAKASAIEKNVFQAEIDVNTYYDDNGDKGTKIVIPEEYFIIELNKMTDKLLIKYGYTNEEIKDIREQAAEITTSYSLLGTEKDRSRQKYGKLTYSITPTSLTYSKTYKRTTLKTTMTWEWSKAPIFRKVDIPALCTSEGFAFYSGTGTATYYWHGKPGEASTKKSLDIETEDNGTGAYAYNMQMQNWYSSPKKGNYVPLKGEINVTWRKSGKIVTTGVSANYGHSEVKLFPSVSFRNFGISFSFGISSGPDAYATINMK